jgi:hypothetical protein
MASSLGPKLKTSVEINLELSTKTNKPDSFAITGAEVAEQSVFETIEALEKTAKQSGLLDQIYDIKDSYGKRGIAHQALEKQSAHQEESIESLIRDALEIFQIKTIAQNYLQRHTNNRNKQISDYFETFEDPITEELDRLHDKQSQSHSRPVKKQTSILLTKNKQSKTNWRYFYGKSKLSIKEIRFKEKQSKDFKSLRESIAKSCLPMGLGFSCKIEYQLFIVKHLFLGNHPEYQVDEEDQAYRCFNIKARFEKKLAHESRVLWQIIEDKLSISLKQYEQKGTQSQRPRSANALIKNYLCSKQVALAVIEVYKLLPECPAGDIAFLNHFSRQLIKQKNIRDTEIEIYWNENTLSYQSCWVKKVADKIALLQHEMTKKMITQMDALSSLSITQKELKKIAIKTPGIRQAIYHIIKEKLQQQVVSDEELNTMIEQYFELSRQQTDIVNGNNSHFKELIEYYYKKTKSFKLMKIIYDNFLKSIEDKPKITDYVCNFQQHYLKTGKQTDLKPLTKSRVVEALGFLPSSDYNKEDHDSQRQEKAITGRRLERYMKQMVVYHKGQSLKLDNLIPGNGGVKQVSGKHLTKVMVKEKIKEILKKENKQKPLSDQKIRLQLIKAHGIKKISRETVKGYRNQMGILSSQGRLVI